MRLKLLFHFSMFLHKRKSFPIQQNQNTIFCSQHLPNFIGVFHLLYGRNTVLLMSRCLLLGSILLLTFTLVLTCLIVLFLSFLFYYLICPFVNWHSSLLIKMFIMQLNLYRWRPPTLLSDNHHCDPDYSFQVLKLVSMFLLVFWLGCTKFID